MVCEDKNIEFYSFSILSDMFDQNKSLITNVVQSFLKQTPPLLHELSIGSEKGDWKLVGQLCHRLKASYKTFGIDSLEDAISSLEIQDTSYSDNERKNLVDRISNVSQKVFDDLNKRKVYL